MARVSESQLRLVYSLLRTPMRIAARFRIPVGTLLDLVRVSYFETLSRKNLTKVEVARRMGQTDRHMRTIAAKHSDLFAKQEENAGTVREVETLVALRAPLASELATLLPSHSKVDVRRALETLLAEGRIVQGEDGRLQTGARYASLATDTFFKRLDGLNNHLDALHQAVVHRLIYSDQHAAILKTISFSANPAKLAALVWRVEGELRRDLAALEEDAEFGDSNEARFLLAPPHGTYDSRSPAPAPAVCPPAR